MKIICVGDSPKNKDGRPCYTLSEAIKLGDISLRMSGKEGLITTLNKTSNDVIVIQQAALNPAIIKNIRSYNIKTPILIISRNLTANEVSETLDSGADDYVDITVNPKELLSRMNALVRRSDDKMVTGNSLIIGRMTIHEKEKNIFIDERIVNLTKSEYNVILLIARKRGKMINREAIYNALYVGRDKPSNKTLDVMIFRIRKKFDLCGIENAFITSRNLGYCINEAAFTPVGARDQDMYIAKNHHETSMPVSVNNTVNIAS